MNLLFRMRLAYYRGLMQIRLSAFGSLLKRILRVQRYIHTTQIGMKFIIDPVSDFGV
ncbi:MAG: hypothetical protein AB4911_10535 [Oscillochloridaceae bacterium umkhey_bin13]